MSDERKPMTDEELAEIKKRLDAITSEALTNVPWKAYSVGKTKSGFEYFGIEGVVDAGLLYDRDYGYENGLGIDGEMKATFIANAPTDISRLLAEVERLREEVKGRDKIVVELKEEVASLQGDLDFASREQHILTRKLFDSRICHKAVLCEQKNPEEWKFEGEDGCERCWDEWVWHLATDAIEEAERNAE